MDEKRSTAAPFVVAVLLLLPCLYVGSYVAMLETRNVPLTCYRYGGGIAARIYQPVNWVDRRLRPAYWTRIKSAGGGTNVILRDVEPRP